MQQVKSTRSKLPLPISFQQARGKLLTDSNRTPWRRKQQVRPKLSLSAYCTAWWYLPKDNKSWELWFCFRLPKNYQL